MATSLTLFISMSLAAVKQTHLPYQHFTPDLKKAHVAKLTPLQKYVTQDQGTERKGSGKYYNFFKPGIYVDVVSGEPLFSSTNKYQADSGWPAFTKPINKQALNIIQSHTWYGASRYRLSSSIAHSHLGDLIYDRYVKQPPHNGAVIANDSEEALPRYCIDSASLKFIPLSEMEKQGYGQYIKYVTTNKQITQPVKTEKAIFAGGCFWCLASDFDYFKKQAKLSHHGIEKVVSGYDGGTRLNPTYEQVSSSTTKYKESVEVIYNPKKISYKNLVEYFYRRINPLDPNGQFCDQGPQYQSAIYYTTDKQKHIAQAVTADVRAAFTKTKAKQIYTQVLASTTFYPAETYHQDYHDKNPVRYCYYRTRCGRDATVTAVWQHINWPYSSVIPFKVPKSSIDCLLKA